MSATKAPNRDHVRDEDVLNEAMEGEVTANLSHIGAGRGEVDVQVATAKRFPRSITTFIRRAIEMATLTPEIAAACVYALPRKEEGRTKMIEGPSARLAEICASAWGNMRIDGRVVNIDDNFITTRGTAWDLESNVAIAYEVKRRITTRQGTRYTDDMIVVTGNAGASIAIRNAVFKTIPTAFWKSVYAKVRQVIAGDAQTFHSRRDAMVKAFGVMGVPPEKLCAVLDVKGVADITLDHMATLTGIYNAIKEGEISIEEAFDKERSGVTRQAAPAKVTPSAPEGFDDWFSDLTAVADNGTEALEEFWAAPASQKFRLHLVAVSPTAFESLKAKAEKVKPTEGNDEDTATTEPTKTAATPKPTDPKPGPKPVEQKKSAPADDDPFDLKGGR